MADVLIAKDHIVNVMEATDAGPHQKDFMRIFYRSHTRASELEMLTLPISFQDYLFGLKQAAKNNDIPDFSSSGIEKLKQDIKAASGARVVEGSNLAKGWQQNVGP